MSEHIITRGVKFDTGVSPQYHPWTRSLNTRNDDRMNLHTAQIHSWSPSNIEQTKRCHPRPLAAQRGKNPRRGGRWTGLKNQNFSILSSWNQGRSQGRLGKHIVRVEPPFIQMCDHHVFIDSFSQIHFLPFQIWGILSRGGGRQLSRIKQEKLMHAKSYRQACCYVWGISFCLMCAFILKYLFLYKHS